MSKQDKEQDGVLLKEVVKILSPGMLRWGDAIAGKGELVEDADYLFINEKYKGILAHQILVKAREAVEGTRLKLNRGGILSDVEVAYYNNGAEAQTQAILRALGGGE